MSLLNCRLLIVAFSGRRLECPTKARESRVHERRTRATDANPKYGGTRGILPEFRRPTKTIFLVRKYKKVRLLRLNTFIDR